jgi:hypothetical protein
MILIDEALIQLYCFFMSFKLLEHINYFIIFNSISFKHNIASFIQIK